MLVIVPLRSVVITPWSMLARMSRAKSVTWFSVRRTANWRCWSQSVATVQSNRAARAVDRMMIRVPMSRCNERISAADTGPEPASQAPSKRYSSRPGRRRPRLRAPGQHQRGEDDCRRLGDARVNFGGPDAKHRWPIPSRPDCSRAGSLGYRRDSTRPALSTLSLRQWARSPSTMRFGNGRPR